MLTMQFTDPVIRQNDRVSEMLIAFVISVCPPERDESAQNEQEGIFFDEGPHTFRIGLGHFCLTFPVLDLL